MIKELENKQKSTVVDKINELVRKVNDFDDNLKNINRGDMP